MYQQITIIGNLGRDPEMRYLPDGNPVTNMNIATNRRWTDNATGQQHEETTWFRVSVWGRQAEACNTYLRQGHKVMIVGRLRPDPSTGGPRVWTSQSGNIGASYEVTADRIVFLTPKNGNGEANDTPATTEDDDIPF